MQAIRDFNTCGGCHRTVVNHHDAFLQLGLLFCDVACLERFYDGYKHYPYKNRYFNLPCAQCMCGFTVRAHDLYHSARGDYFCRQLCLDGRKEDIALRKATTLSCPALNE
jgi:hypothetical protein